MYLHCTYIFFATYLNKHNDFILPFTCACTLPLRRPLPLTKEEDEPKVLKDKPNKSSFSLVYRHNVISFQTVTKQRHICKCRLPRAQYNAIISKYPKRHGFKLCDFPVPRSVWISRQFLFALIAVSVVRLSVASCASHNPNFKNFRSSRAAVIHQALRSISVYERKVYLWKSYGWVGQVPQLV
jgi:hypothetical protein